jgi:hypothetical protein
MQPRVLRFIDHAHPPAAQLFDNAIVGDCAADEKGGVRHFTRILRSYETPSQRSPAASKSRKPSQIPQGCNWAPRKLVSHACSSRMLQNVLQEGVEMGNHRPLQPVPTQPDSPQEYAPSPISGAIQFHPLAGRTRPLGQDSANYRSRRCRGIT